MDLRRSMLRFPLRSRITYNENPDRFIPNRSAMDMDYARYMIMQARKNGKENSAAPNSPSREAYLKRLRETLGLNRTRILAFRNKPPSPKKSFCDEYLELKLSKPVKPRRHIPQNSELALDAPDIMDDNCLNLLDWSSSDIIAIALSDALYLWNASTRSVTDLATVNEETGPITSVSWAPDGKYLAVGLNNSEVELWDSTANRKLRTLQGGHASRVGSLAWNNHILTTGGMDGRIINNDVRVSDHIVGSYRGHEQEICGLKWSSSGRQLASGGSDSLLHIFDISVGSSESGRQWIHRIKDHTAAVRALAWCPFQNNLLASGGGGNDRCIKFWNAHNGACLNSLDTGSEVCALMWSKNERELLSSLGFTQNQLVLWRYPSMVKMAELAGHISRPLFMAQSPVGSMVASVAGDEALKLWNIFGAPQVAKQAPKHNAEPFSSFNRIR